MPADGSSIWIEIKIGKKHEERRKEAEGGLYTVRPDWPIFENG